VSRLNVVHPELHSCFSDVVLKDRIRLNNNCQKNEDILNKTVKVIF